MAPKRNSNGTTEQRAAPLQWTDSMEIKLFETFLDQHRKGKRSDSGWKPEAWKAVVEAVEGKNMTLTVMTKQHCQSKETTFRDHFKDHMFLEEKSGFHFNVDTGMWEAPEACWEELAKTRKSCLWNRRNKLRYLDTLSELYRTTLANGHDSFTFGEHDPSITDGNAEDNGSPSTDDALREIDARRKRLRQMEESPAPRRRSDKGVVLAEKLDTIVSSLATSRMESARQTKEVEVVVTQHENKVIFESMAILNNEYSTRVTQSELLKAIGLLGDPRQATMFMGLTASGMDSRVRDSWLAKNTGISIRPQEDYEEESEENESEEA